MKKILQPLIPVLIFLLVGFYSNIYDYITSIYIIQTVPLDSLAIGHDRSPHVGDTVTVTGRVTAPPRVNVSGGDTRVLLRGTTSRTAFIQDTLNNIWGGIAVRQADTISNTNFDQLDSGMKVTVKGIVQETPDQLISGLTQIKLDTIIQVQTLPTIKRRPLPITVNVSDFDSLGNIKFITGEKYEGMYVQLNNVTIGPGSPSGQRHIRSLFDGTGNKIYLRDFSNFYSANPFPANGWTPWVPPGNNTIVSSIRGVIMNGAYTDGTFNGIAEYPYVIVPVYPNDLTIGNTAPFIDSVSRNPGVPKPSDVVNVSALITDTLDYVISVDSVQLIYRINRGQYTSIPMTHSGNIYNAVLNQQPVGTLVEYFISAKDNQGAYRFSPADTSKSTYFYFVHTTDTMTIKDIQYTPNNGGVSGFNGYIVTTEGIVTADTSDIPAFSFASSGGIQTSPKRVIIQDPAISGGWSGIWISGSGTDQLVRGQRVRMRGMVTEVNSVTSIISASASNVIIVSSGNPLPAPEVVTPAAINDLKQDGDTTAEKWESVLVRFSNQFVITCINASQSEACTSGRQLPDTLSRRNFGEVLGIYNSENSPARVELQDGGHTFVNGWDSTLANWYHPNYPGHLLYQFDGINSLIGILYYGSGHYKLVPRKNEDFGTIIAVEPISEIAASFWLRQNYPNPFNPITNIVYNIPTESHVTLRVYNVLGQVVTTLIDGIQNKGKYLIPFEGSNFASGLYFYILEGETFEGNKFKDVKKMVLVK